MATRAQWQHRAGNMRAVVDDSGLRALVANQPDVAERAVRWVAFRTAAEAQMNIRAVNAIDTSYMVNTTAARRVGRFLWTVGTAAFYGVYVEYGTVRMGARPWLTPAVQRARELFAAILRNTLPEAAR